MPSYKNKLFILPFDHRGSLIRDILGRKDKLTYKDKKYISDLKFLIYQGFLMARRNYQAPENLAILIDDEFGKAVVEDAQKKGVNVFLTTEKTGEKEFKFLYGNKFGQVLKKYHVSGAKALLRYNPRNKSLNISQLLRLKKLQEFCGKNKLKFLLEPLILPEPQDLAKVGNSKERYDREMRAKLFVKSVKEMRAQGIDPDIWKIEAFFSKKDWRKAIKAVRDNKAHKDVCIILLGRGESKAQVIEWIKTASGFDINGFAIGRTIFLKEIISFHQGKITGKQAVEKIAKNFFNFLKIWEKK